VSVGPNDGQLGVRTEIKNLNSFRAIQTAIQYEIERQIGIVSGGGEVESESRGFEDGQAAVATRFVYNMSV
jgi:aspartyl-tRNA(Asn)/glutamyl-tRNA(Gln) amidotransferase subunit B